MIFFCKNLSVVAFGIFMCFCSWEADAQADPDQLSYKDPSPKSPEAQMLINFVDIPVNKYTGLPNVNIPILSAEAYDIGAGIGLEYHAGGHKVSEVASNVGLGWRLTGIPTITRKIVGLADDTDIGEGFLDARENYTFNEVQGWQTNRNTTEVEVTLRGCRDFEPDEFYFSIGNYSGKFAFAWDTNLPIMMSGADVAIESYTRHPNTGIIVEWVLVDPTGFKYTFSKLEYTTLNNPLTSISVCTSGERKYVTTWFVSKIESLTSDKINEFFYENYSYEQDWMYSELRRYNDGTNNSGCAYPPNGASSFFNSNVKIDGQRISSITIANKYKIDFLANTNRSDVQKLLSHSNFRSIDKIKLSNISGQLIKYVDLHYYYQGRLMLDNIQTFGANGESIPEFDFTYHGGVFPDIQSKSVDHWGYYNGANNVTLLPRYIHKTGSVFTVFDGADRKVDPEKTKTAILKNIVHPNGGTTDLIFEGNDYSFIGSQEVSDFDQYEEVDEQVSVSVLGDELFWEYSQKPFTITSPGTEVVVSTQGYSWVTFGGSIFLPRVRILDSNGNQVAQRTLGLNTNPNGNPPDQAFVDHWVLPAGDYVIVCQARRYNSPSGPDYISSTLNVTNIVLNPSIVTKPAGGLRVKSLAQNGLVRTYAYNMGNVSSSSSGNISSGSIGREPQYIYQDTRLYQPPSPSIIIYECHYLTLEGSNKIDLGNTLNSHIGYRRVEELIGENGDEGGKIISEFSSQFNNPNGINDTRPYGRPISTSYRHGELNKEYTYAKGDGGFVLKRLSEIDYERRSIDFQSIKMSFGVISPVSGSSIIQTAYQAYDFDEKYAFWYGTLRYGINKLKSTTTTDYFPSGNIITVQTSTYDSQLQNKISTSLTATGLSKTVEYKYAQDLGIACMVDQHMTGVPVQILIDGGAGGGSRAVYSSTGYNDCVAKEYQRMDSKSNAWLWVATLHDFNSIGQPSKIVKRGNRTDAPTITTTLDWVDGLLEKHTVLGDNDPDRKRTWHYYTKDRTLEYSIDIDGQRIDYAYDGLQRLESVNSRQGAMTESYGYNYQPVAGKNSIYKSIDISNTSYALNEEQFFDEFGRSSLLVKPGYAASGDDWTEGVSYNMLGSMITSCSPAQGGCYTSIYEKSVLQRKLVETQGGGQNL